MNALIKSAALALCTSAALLAGCASDTKLDDSGKPAPIENRVGAGGTGAAGSGTSQSQVTSVDLSKNNNADAAGRVVYFDYDSYAVKDEYRPLIETQAKALSATKGKKLTIEGHTDERGGSEYNLALGQKRAEAVVKQLKLLGAGEAQVEAVSFGKERPAALGNDEASWAKNRRAELSGR